MKRQLYVGVCALLLPLSVAMAQTVSEPSAERGHAATSRDGEVKGWIYGEAVPGSPFARIEIGMRSEQVYRLLGAPDKVVYYPTGKGFIPFYFGGDAGRTEWFYKAQGGIAFETKQTGALGAVRAITYDASASFN